MPIGHNLLEHIVDTSRPHYCATYSAGSLWLEETLQGHKDRSMGTRRIGVGMLFS
jgi:hypothetical protein